MFWSLLFLWVHSTFFIEILLIAHNLVTFLEMINVQDSSSEINNFCSQNESTKKYQKNAIKYFQICYQIGFFVNWFKALPLILLLGHLYQNRFRNTSFNLWKYFVSVDCGFNFRKPTVTSTPHFFYSTLIFIC
jgi:hypothetical protein